MRLFQPVLNSPVWSIGIPDMTSTRSATEPAEDKCGHDMAIAQFRPFLAKGALPTIL